MSDVKCVKCEKVATATRKYALHIRSGGWVLNPANWTDGDTIQLVTFDLCDEHARHFDQMG